MALALAIAVPRDWSDVVALGWVCGLGVRVSIAGTNIDVEGDETSSSISSSGLWVAIGGTNSDVDGVATFSSTTISSS